MPNLIDRRLNPKDKSLSNRQRFLQRVREQLKKTIDGQIRTGRIADVDADHVVPAPLRGAGEPGFYHSANSGARQHVLPGNREYSPGGRIPKQGAGAGAAQKGAGRGGEAEDNFHFVLSREEVLDLFFEDLELPDLVRLSLKDVVSFKWRRAGFATTGAPTNINVGRTMRNSYGRRIALKRPKQEELDRIASEIAALEAGAGMAVTERLSSLRAEYDRLARRRRMIAYVDPVDIRFNRFQPQPLPNASAVMFCLMDVSGSMGEREKDLAKRFFVLLHLFLKRRYERIEMVFIRHTHEAREVDEETFFHSKQTGGTVVSTALAEMRRIIAARYSSDEWNIYAAQASDGGNDASDSELCVSMIENEIMGLCQYYAYVEIIDEREAEVFRAADNGTPLWNAYRALSGRLKNFQMTRIAGPTDIYPVFRKLFARQPSKSQR